MLILHYVPFDILTFNVLSHSTFCLIPCYFCLTVCPIRRFVPFDIFYVRYFVRSTFLLIRYFVRLTFCIIRHFGIRHFVPFDVLSFDVLSFDVLSFRRLLLRHFVGEPKTRQRQTTTVRQMVESGPGPKRAIAEAVTCPLRIQPSINNHSRLTCIKKVIQIDKILIHAVGGT
jgi:hypothetical protein